jgi:hypothetical protein
MKLANLINGFELHLPMTGGKAGKGHNVTSTFQLRKNGAIAKQFRFTLNKKESRQAALKKAHDFVRQNA